MLRLPPARCKPQTTSALSVTVIIPTLNESARIGFLLQALSEQRYDALQIIVVDGASEDGTSEIVQHFPQVLCLTGKRGTARQRNAGAQAALGELLIFMDADNHPGPNFVRDVAHSFRRLPFGVACPWFVARESAAIRTAYFSFNVLFWLGQSTLRTGSGVCLIAPRAVWQKCGGFRDDLHLGEDVEFLRRAARYGWHRHLLIGLETSGRRFERDGVVSLLRFYARISPLILLGRWDALQKLEYRASGESKQE